MMPDFLSAIMGQKMPPSEMGQPMAPQVGGGPMSALATLSQRLAGGNRLGGVPSLPRLRPTPPMGRALPMGMMGGGMMGAPEPLAMPRPSPFSAYRSE